MKRRLLLAPLLAAFFTGRGFAAAADEFKTHVAPVLERYCTDCHGPERQKGKVNLAGPRSAEQLAAGSDQWFRMLEQVEAGKMPPKEEEQPTPGERATLTAWVRGEFTQMMLARQQREGRSQLRRLTRSEYANTVEDLFGVRPTVEKNLPADGLVNGYDKVSGALQLSADGALGYLKMADEQMEWVLQPLPKPAASAAADLARRTVHAPAMESLESKGQSLTVKDGAVVSFNSDASSGSLDLPVKVPGLHRVRVSVYGYQTGKPLPFGIFVGNTFAYPQEINLAWVLEAPPARAAILETAIYLPAGQGIRLIPFGLGVPVPKNAQASGCRAPGLAVQWLEDVAPPLPLPGDRWLTADFPPALSQELRTTRETTLAKGFQHGYRSHTTTPEQWRALLEKTYRRVGARFFRRDLRDAEVAGFTNEALRQSEDGVPLVDAFKNQIVEMMTAPDFLCLVEAPGRLSDFALASRLAYFLWNSTPDEALLEVARRGRLHEPKVLAEQTERLMKDGKFAGFINDFADQWLGLRAIAETSPDGQLYPDYDELLRFSSLQETRAFLKTLVAENRSARELVAAPWTWLNEPLAALYQVPGVAGARLQRVELPRFSPYGGVWTQSSILKVTANGTNTSPVKRGVWVSERLLGIHIPPPPPSVTPVEPDTRGAKTLREQLAMHSSNASCAACHARFDPYGFALESFDVTGGFRTRFREANPAFANLAVEQRKGTASWRAGLPVDCAGQTPEGRPFSDITELRRLLAQNPRQLALGFTRHLITYATGTPPGPVDEPAVAAMVDQAAEGDYPMRTLIRKVIESSLFQSK